MDGFLNLLKPPGMSSGDMVLYVRRRVPKGVRVGHGGTLDPDACGVLPVCVGNAVRLFDYIIDKQKTYLGEIRLGIETDTQDASGRIVRQTDASGIDGVALSRALPEFTGRIWQTPPAYSAVHKDGKRLYELARTGRDTAVEKREAVIDMLEYAGQSAPGRYLLRVRCGKGVYIRTLFHDIGQFLGCGAHMSMLIRERAGEFDIADAVPISAIEPGRIEALLKPLDFPLSRYPVARVGENREHFVRNGNVLRAEWLETDAAPGAVVRLYMGERFAGMCDLLADGGAKFRAMLIGGQGT